MIKVNKMARGVTFHPSGHARMNTRAGIRVRVRGVGVAANELSRRFKKLGGATMQGLLVAGAFIREDMDKTPPLVPIDTGALRAAFKINAKPAFKMNKAGEPINGVELGWPDDTISRPNKTTGKIEEVKTYAAYVHEMTVPPYTHPINWSRPGSGAKFFEYALLRNQDTIVHIVAMFSRGAIL